MKTKPLVVLSLTVAFLLLRFVSICAQTDTGQLIAEIRRAYEQLNYSEAEIKAMSVLKEYNRFSAVELTEVHKILGIIYFSHNKPGEARVQFESALTLTPELALDPMLVSPKILEFFEETKRQLPGARADLIHEGNTSTPQIRYVTLEDPRPAAALRSLVLPGWGQRYKGENTKGILLTSLWAAGLVGTVAAHVARQSAEDDYLAEKNPVKIDSRYDTFNARHKLRNNLALFTAGVWLFSYADAVLRRTSVEDGFKRAQQRVSIQPQIWPAPTTLSVQFKF